MRETKTERRDRYILTKSIEENAKRLRIKNRWVLDEMRRAALREEDEMRELKTLVGETPDVGLPETGGFELYLRKTALLYVAGIVKESDFTEFTRLLRQAKTLYEGFVEQEKKVVETAVEGLETG